MKTVIIAVTMIMIMIMIVGITDRKAMTVILMVITEVAFSSAFMIYLYAIIACPHRVYFAWHNILYLFVQLHVMHSSKLFLHGFWTVGE